MIFCPTAGGAGLVGMWKAFHELHRFPVGDLTSACFQRPVTGSMPPLIITESAYQFVPPHEGEIWPRVLSRIVPTVLRRSYGVTNVELRGAEKLQALLDAGDGVLLAPNHCRMSDPLLMQSITR